MIYKNGEHGSPCLCPLGMLNQLEYWPLTETQAPTFLYNV